MHTLTTVLLLAVSLASALADEATDASAAMTRDALPGAKLKSLTPEKLGGAARTHLLVHPWAVAAAYRVGAGFYNLDIKNTFHRGSGGDDTIEKLIRQNCRKPVTVGGHAACLRVSEGRASLHWYLPDRLTVDLAASDEATVRKLGSELPMGKLAALSRAK